MHIELERKFLVKDDSYKAFATSSHRIRQGYIAHDAGRTVRVRLIDGKGILTIKGPSTDGISRLEWEKEIPFQDALDLFSICKSGSIDKTRFIVPTSNPERFFEVDEFYGDNEGLTVAEIELASTEEEYDHPDWLSDEVTGDKRYYNSQLIKNPFNQWH